jgi:predicted nucleic acid-binding protein
VLAGLREHREEIATAAPVWHELIYGYARLPPSRKREAIESYLFRTVRASIPILPYDSMAAEWHAAERARLAALGKTPPRQRLAAGRSEAASSSRRYFPQIAGSEWVPWPRVSGVMGSRM